MRDLPRAMATDRRYYGVVEGLVVENTGDDEGRIKVRFPWLDDRSVTDWCRISQLYAGDGYGSLFVPEIGDEVVVAFVHGDMRFPIILGGLYNGQDKPPVAPVDGRDQKIIRTRAGHRILFDDKQDQAAVRIVSAAGHTMEMDDSGTAVRITAATGGTVTVTADGSITLKAATVTVDATAIELGAGASHPVPFGDVLLAAFNAHTHVVPGAGTSAPPAPPLTGPAALSNRTRTS
ncbi:phage baseplate assembly protein V [Actinoplanes sp. CA-131856]